MGALLPDTPLAVEAGGIEMTGSLETALLLNLHLRTASRVLVRLAGFRAAHFDRLRRGAAEVDWSRVVRPDGAVTFAVTSRKSRLYHTGAIEERVLDVVRDQLPGVATGTVEGRPETRIVVRIVRDQVTLSVDASGDHLHQRGSRVATGSAPLRETIAAALLMAVGWTGETPLVDPVCGSGTLLLEGALLASGRAPGASRAFACEIWPAMDTEVAERLRREAHRTGSDPEVRLMGRDRSRPALEAAQANLEAAGLSHLVELEEAPVSAPLDPRVDAPWCMVANPPWGLRMGEESGLRDLYATLGRLAREGADDAATVGIVCPSERLVAATGLRLAPTVRLRQGGVNLAFWTPPPGRQPKRGE